MLKLLQHQLNLTVENNNVYGNAYASCGLEINGRDITVSNNKIYSYGNYTYGIALGSVADGTTIDHNVIYCNGSNVGEDATGDGFIPAGNSKAISISGDVIVKNNEIFSTNIGINAIIDGKMSFEDNTIVVTANSGKVDNYAIVADNIADLNITNNKVTYYGLVDYQFVVVGSYVYDGVTYYIYDTSNNTNAYGVYVKNSNAVIKNNDFDIAIPTFAVNWGATRESFSEGIVLAGCDDLVFSDNTVLIKSNGGSSYDTLYGIDILNSANPSVKNNKITLNGAGYSYGIIINDENFTISQNNISVTSDNYACGVDVEGPAKGVVDDNVITAVGVDSAYPIYTGMIAGQEVAVNITNNDVEGKAYYVVGIEIAANKALIENNNVDVDGNHTIGVGTKVSDVTIKGNAINAFASNEGNQSVWDGMKTANCAIKVIEGNATIFNNSVASNAIGINADSTNDKVTIENNNIIVNANSGKVDNYAIFADEIDDLSIVGNDVMFNGLVDNQFVIIGYDSYDWPIYDASNNTRAYGIYIKKSNVKVENNTFDINIPTFTVNWGAVREAFSEGIVLDGCDDLIFKGNDVTVTAINGSSYDTIYGIDVLNSANANIVDNSLILKGKGYSYGIIINDVFTISKNNITVLSDNYACGIEVEGSGMVSNNTVVAIATTTAYPIYSGMDYIGALIVDYVDNQVYGNAYFVVGMSLSVGKEDVVNNTIIAEGNYTVGIGSVSNDNNISGNIIRALGNGIGDQKSGDYYYPIQNTGIVILKADANITDNYIEATNGDYAVDLAGTNSTVDDNYLASKKSVGTGAIANRLQGWKRILC